MKRNFDSDCQRVSVAQAAREIGLSEQGLRVQMDAGRLKEIGYVIPPVQGTRKQYLIFRNKLDAYLGK